MQYTINRRRPNSEVARTHRRAPSKMGRQQTLIALVGALLVCSVAGWAWVRGVPSYGRTSTEYSGIGAPGRNLPVAAAAAAVPTPAASSTTIKVGLGKTDLESVLGLGTLQGSWMTYKGGEYKVKFNNANVWHIEHILTNQNAVDLPTARAQAKAFLPSDAKFMMTESPTEGVVQDVYHSEWLKSRFATTSGTWPGGFPAGTFMLVHRINSALPGGNMVISTGIAVGNDPAINNP